MREHALRNYDFEGNRETRTKISTGYVTRYEWDFRNRLVKVTEEDNASGVLQVTENFYDPFNQWIRRSFDADGPSGTAAVETFFIYESGQIVLQFDGSDDSDLSHRYLWGERVDQLFADETITSLGSAGSVIWPLGDHVGTVRDLVTYNSTTDDATIANHREYNTFGSLTNESNSSVELVFGFTGRPFDNTTELQNNLYRWYDAQAGKWIAEDRVGFVAGDANLSRYVSNTPTTSIDADGLQELQDSGIPLPSLIKPTPPSIVVEEETAPNIDAAIQEWNLHIQESYAGFMIQQHGNSFLAPIPPMLTPLNTAQPPLLQIPVIMADDNIELTPQQQLELEEMIRGAIARAGRQQPRTGFGFFGVRPGYTFRDGTRALISPQLNTPSPSELRQLLRQPENGIDCLRGLNFSIGSPALSAPPQDTQPPTHVPGHLEHLLDILAPIIPRPPGQ